MYSNWDVREAFRVVSVCCICVFFFFFFVVFFFNDTATTEIYTLSLHDALPICVLRIEKGNIRISALCMELDVSRASVYRCPTNI